jgi:hypothetical protein
MGLDGCFVQSLIVEVPLASILWLAWFRRKIPRTRLTRWLVAGSTAFLLRPIAFSPYGSWNLYPAWCTAVLVLFGADPIAILVFCVDPVLLRTSAAIPHSCSSRVSPQRRGDAEKQPQIHGDAGRTVYNDGATDTT